MLAATPSDPMRRAPTMPSRARLFIDLLYMLTWRDIKIRYKQSVMGMLWAVFMPALIVGAGLVVRLAMGQLGGAKTTPLDVAALSVKALAWAFIVGSLRFGTMSLAGNSNLLTKINVPRIVFPISAVLSTFFDFAIALAPLLVILAVCGVQPTLLALWAPVLIALMLMLVTGAAIIFAVGNLFLRDVKYIVEVVLTFAIFFTPVLYEVRMLGDMGHWLLLNPLAPLLEGLGAAVVRGEPPPLPWIGYSAVFALLTLAFAGWLFSRLEGLFADYV